MAGGDSGGRGGGVGLSTRLRQRGEINSPGGHRPKKRRHVSMGSLEEAGREQRMTQCREGGMDQMSVTICRESQPCAHTTQYCLHTHLHLPNPTHSPPLSLSLSLACSPSAPPFPEPKHTCTHTHTLTNRSQHTCKNSSRPLVIRHITGPTVVQHLAGRNLHAPVATQLMRKDYRGGVGAAIFGMWV